MTSVAAQTLEHLQQENARLLALLGQRYSTIQNLQHQLHLFCTARFGRVPLYEKENMKRRRGKHNTSFGGAIIFAKSDWTLG